MKKTTFLPALVVLLITIGIFSFEAVNAQNPQIAASINNSTPEQRAKMQTMLMKNKLQLDSAQVLKVDAINFKYAQMLGPIIKSDNRGLEKFRKMKSVNDRKNNDLKAVFTADQYKQYQVFEQEIKDKMIEKVKEKRGS